MQIGRTGDDDTDINFNLAGKIVLLSGLTLSSYAVFGLSPILPAIAAHFSYNPNAGLLIRMLVSGISMTMALTSPIVGAVADRVGARRVLLAGMVVYAVAGCAPFFLDDIYAILISRIIMGFAVAAIGAVILAILVAHSSGSARNRWLGYLTTTATVVSVIYSPLVGYIGRFGWRWPFLTFALVLPLIALTILGIERDPPHTLVRKVQNGDNSSLRFTIGTPLGFVIFSLVAGAVLVGPGVFIPFRMREIGITDSTTIGMLFIPGSISGVIAGFSYGWIRSKLSIPLAFVVGFSAMAAGLMAMATALGTVQIVLGQITFGFGLGMNMPSYFTLAALAGSDTYRARTMGFAKTGVYGGPMIAQLLLEPIVLRTDFKFALSLFGVSCVGFACFYAWRAFSQHHLTN